MGRRDCGELLQWALPRLGLRWPAYIKVRRQVCRRLDERRQRLDLPSVGAYRAYLEAHPDEWAELAVMCRITISRFYRDAMVFDALREVLADREGPLRAWSAGCASGEEAWTLHLMSGLDARVPRIEVLATDADPHMIARARAGRYPASSLRELPAAWRQAGFHTSKDAFRLRDEWRDGVELRVEALPDTLPDGPFDLIACRNLAFLYFDAPRQARVLDALVERLAPGGWLLIGRYDALPDDTRGLRAHPRAPCLYVRTAESGVPT